MPRPAIRRLAAFTSIACSSLALSATAGAWTRPASDSVPEPAQSESAASAADVSQPASDFRVYWRDGVHFETADKAFRANFGGRFHLDWGWQSGDDSLDPLVPATDSFDDGLRFRRARMHVGGTMYENLDYMVEFDFAGGSAGWRNVYVGTAISDFGNLRIGHQKQPFGLEQLTSSNNMTFMERATLEIFTPFYKTGANLAGSFADDDGTWAVGLFRETDAFGNDLSDDGGYGGAARVTYLPHYEGDGKSLVHLGLAASHRGTNDDELRLRARTENSFAPRLVDTGVLDADTLTSFGAEAAWVHGPLSLQAEYMIADVSSDASDDPRFVGYYGMVSWFLTGEHRPYRRRAGIFDRVRPARNFGEDGSGALELALRFSHLDLNDGPVEGGEVDGITAGVNWYLNPGARVMLNYVHSTVERGPMDGDVDALLLRLQVTF